MPGFKLIYFDARGRVEPTRILFAACGIPFKDERWSKEEFDRMKQNDQFLTLPMLEVEGNGLERKLVLHQSMAINRYLTRCFGLDGDTLENQGLVEDIIENIVELKSKIFSMIFEPSENATKNFKIVMSKMCPRLEGQIQQNMRKGAGFAVGSKMTFADIIIYEAFESVVSQNPDALNAYPGIRLCREKTANHPAIARYLRNRKPTQF